MKKNWIRVISACMLLMFAMCAACAEEQVYTINEALGMIGNGQDRIRVSDDMSFLKPDSSAEYGGLGEKFLVLMRFDGKKAFTKSSTPFADDFIGESIEETVVYLCADQMAKIPEEYRATSLEEADTIFIADAYYSHTNTVTVTDYEDSGSNNVMPVADSPEDIEKLKAYLDQQTPVATETTYYPRFTACQDINVYEKATGGVAWYEYTFIYPEEIRDNPEAANYWDKLEDVASLIGIAASEDAANRTEEMMAIVSAEDFLLADRLELYELSIEKGMFQDMAASLESNYWTLAEKMIELEPDAKVGENYKAILESKDYAAFAALVYHQDYSGFAMSIEDLEKNELHLANYDTAWLEENLDATINYVFGLE